MPHLGEIMTHLRLVLHMGQVTGTDMVEAHQKGHLTQQDWAEMIQYCRGCSWANRCPDWLDQHETVVGAPHTCSNRQRFAALKTTLEQENA
ncbi:DUF6455 family protein [Ruegeria arenilitoris]|uniref:DUF6455 family protein n=1 Tax=Ruegeria arenilitoris TaxID=1173585 RepID=UPI00147F147B|nr:DUF6455 family protein [Ruegeria arenilitoris]